MAVFTHLLAASSSLLLLLPLVNSCGVLHVQIRFHILTPTANRPRTHNQVVQRASHIFALPNSLPQFHVPQKLFSPLLTSPTNAPSIQAGAFFPDWGYQCFSTDEDAEAAHWPPFLIAAVEHITSKYGFLNETANAFRSSDEQRHLESLIAFMFAVAAHQTADATWHAIRLPTGFLAALAGVDFGGDSGQAHTNLDIGGDFLAAARLGRLSEESRQWIENSWVVPVDDLVAIYERIGRAISKPVLRYCCMRGLAALRSELVLGGKMLESFAVKSPMMVDEIDGYYLGGMYEMSARTVNCWANLTRWFSDGIDAGEKLRGGWGICDVFQAIKARGGPNPHIRHGFMDNKRLAEATMAEMNAIKVTTDSFGAETYTLPPVVLDVKTAQREPSYRSDFEDPIYVATYVPYSNLGASISVVKFHTDLEEISFAVGAPWESEDSSRPGEGNVYIIPNSYISQDHDSPHQLRLNNTHSFRSTQRPSVTPGDSTVDQRFGTASTGLKTLNRTFLAISATGPLTYDSGHAPSLPFHEQVLAGRVELFVRGQIDPEFTFWMRGAELGSIGRRQWGDNLLSAPLFPDSDDEFLIVSGSRTDGERICQGRVKPQYGEGEVTIIQLQHSTATTTATTTITTNRHSKTPHKLKSQHHNISTSETTTTAYHLTLPEYERNTIPCTLQTTYAYFGTSTAFSSHSKTLWISAPGRGKVFGYRFLSSSVPVIPALTIADEDFSLRPRRTGFGNALATGVLSTGQEWIAVAAPNEDVQGMVQAGVVRIYMLYPPGSTKTPRLVAEVIPESPEAFGKFGRTLEVDETNGVLWVGSEFADAERGRVWRVFVEDLMSWRWWWKRGTVTTAEMVWEGKEKGERFGARIVATGGDVVVGVPWAGVGRREQGERFFGALAVFRKRREEGGEL
ncbi:hypothetical protein K440DRAFT_532413 [Wilcoxina mikolae CBS 423.85]|nr:hypothetical protein K440DRAFT_532413 [Wilcoxina mikolae CBS 423.85]